MRKCISDFVELHNSTVLSFVKDIKEYVSFIDPDYVLKIASSFTSNYMLSHNEVYDLRISISNKDLMGYLERLSYNANSEYQKIITELNDFKDKAYCHREKFYDFIQNFTDGYVTLTHICGGHKEYMYVKCSQIIGGDYGMFYGIGTENAGTVSVIVDPRKYILSYMERKEFDEYYYPKRIGVCGLTSEMELSKYGAELTDHFNKLKNRI